MVGVYNRLGWICLACALTRPKATRALIDERLRALSEVAPEARAAGVRATEGFLTRETQVESGWRPSASMRKRVSSFRKPQAR